MDRDETAGLALGPRQVRSYLSRLGMSEDAVGIDIDSLRRLVRRHLEVVPFENLSVHGREPITLTRDWLYHKLVSRGRGGICYELGGGFASLLAGLGYSVKLLSARVYDAEDQLGIPFDHLALEVIAADQPYLVDVGFGDSPMVPLRMAADVVQRGGRIDWRLERVGDAGGGSEGGGGELDVGELWDLWSLEGDGDWKPRYRLGRRGFALRDFEDGCRFHCSAESPLARGPVCSRAEGNGRITLDTDVLLFTDEGGHKRAERVADPDAYRTALRIYFHIDETPDFTLGPRQDL